MRVGFTGTRFGMTEKQRNNFLQLIAGWEPTEFHMGCCKGADKEAAAIYWALCDAPYIVGHPGPLHDPWQDPEVFSLCSEIRPRTNHFARNRNIVHVCDVLLAAPKEPFRQPRGGTWYTYDQAQKIARQTIVLMP